MLYTSHFCPIYFYGPTLWEGDIKIRPYVFPCVCRISCPGWNFAMDDMILRWLYISLRRCVAYHKSSVNKVYKIFTFSFLHMKYVLSGLLLCYDWLDFKITWHKCHPRWDSVLRTCELFWQCAFCMCNSCLGLHFVVDGGILK